MKPTKKQKQVHQLREQIQIKGHELISKLNPSLLAERPLKQSVSLSAEIQTWFAH